VSAPRECCLGLSLSSLGPSTVRCDECNALWARTEAHPRFSRWYQVPTEPITPIELDMLPTMKVCRQCGATGIHKFDCSYARDL
jgi:hypothetical protein